jgi:hypothetical protein
MLELVNNWEVFGLDNSIRASKYPKSTNVEDCTAEITKTTRQLAGCPTGTGHDCFLKGIIVQFDLTYTIKAWTEAERYRFLDFVSSQSTMHMISKFDIGERCISYVKQQTIDLCEELKEAYNANPTPENYLTLLYNVPVGFRLTARMSTNYLQLKTIYQQRKFHRLPEWREFCQWIKTLPEHELITGKDG